jgi:hypothetical protein
VLGGQLGAALGEVVTTPMKSTFSAEAEQRGVEDTPARPVAD